MSGESPAPRPGRTEHVGLALWRAAEAWRRRLSAEMTARGVPWYGEARAALIPLIGPGGARMADLAARSGLSRQAVHQHVEALEADGVLRREPDPDDARGRILRYTDAGLAVLREADAAKRRIEADYAARLGPVRFADLLAALALIAREGREAEEVAPIPPRRRTPRRSGGGSSR